MRRITLRRVNNCLLAAIILLNLYVIAGPFIPAITFWWQINHSQKTQQLSQQINHKTPASIIPVPADNRLIVPSMLIDQPILEGSIASTYATLDKGIWRWPNGSTPDKGSNTILIGHRFTYTNPRGVFYELDKIKIGDEIAIWWQGKEYLYKTTTISIVSPYDLDVLNQSPQAELTLYTCTPTWNPINRLIVVSQLENAQ